MVRAADEERPAAGCAGAGARSRPEHVGCHDSVAIHRDIGAVPAQRDVNPLAAGHGVRVVKLRDRAAVPQVAGHRSGNAVEPPEERMAAAVAVGNQVAARERRNPGFPPERRPQADLAAARDAWPEEPVIHVRAIGRAWEVEYARGRADGHTSRAWRKRDAGTGVQVLGQPGRHRDALVRARRRHRGVGGIKEQHHVGCAVAVLKDLAQSAERLVGHGSYSVRIPSALSAVTMSPMV